MMVIGLPGQALARDGGAGRSERQPARVAGREPIEGVLFRLHRDCARLAGVPEPAPLAGEHSAAPAGPEAPQKRCRALASFLLSGR